MEKTNIIHRLFSKMKMLLIMFGSILLLSLIAPFSVQADTVQGICKDENSGYSVHVTSIPNGNTYKVIATIYSTGGSTAHRVSDEYTTYVKGDNLDNEDFLNVLAQNIHDLYFSEDGRYSGDLQGAAEHTYQNAYLEILEDVDEEELTEQNTAEEAEEGGGEAGDGTVGDINGPACYSEAYNNLKEYWSGNGNREAIDEFWSFYTIATAASDYFIAGQEASPDGDDPYYIKQNLTGGYGHVGNIGALLGRGSENQTVATTTQSYESLKTIKKATPETAKAASQNYKSTASITGMTTVSLYAYSQYGNLLQQIHFDETTIVSTENNGGIGRSWGGQIMLWAYQAVDIVSTLLDAVVTFVSYLNPFAFFVDSLTDSSTSITTSWDMGLSVLEEGTLGGSIESGNGGLRDALNSLYKALYNLGWMVVVPFTFVVLIAGFLLFRASRYNAWGKIRKYITRVALILLGVPVMAWLYTETMYLMSDAVNGTSLAADELIMSTFVDFQSWAQNLKLGVPKEATLEIVCNEPSEDINRPSDATITDLQSTAYAINYCAWGGTTGKTTKDGDAITLSKPSKSQTDTMSLNLDKENMSEVDNTAALSSTDDTNRVTSLLTRYANNDVYLAGDFESTQQAKIQDIAASNNNNLGRLIMFMELTDARCWGSTAGYEDDTYFNDDKERIRITGYYDLFSNDDLWGGKINILSDGGLQETGIDIDKQFENNTIVYNDAGTIDDSTAKSMQSKMRTSGLSTLAMYNYLNTTFDDNQMTMYNPTTTNSEASLEAHTAVNLIGQSGMYQFVYWFNTLVVLLTITIMGVFFAFGLIIDIVKDSVKEIINIPIAVIGSLRAGARMIATAVIMIVEVIGSIFLYELAVELVTFINTDFSNVIIGAIEDLTHTSNLQVGSFAQIILLILTTIATIWVAYAMVKYRKTILSTLEEAVESFTNRLILGNEEGAKIPSQAAANQQAAQAKAEQKAANKGNGVISKAAGGLASGVGMGAAASIMKNASSDGGGKGKKGKGEDEAANQKGGEFGNQGHTNRQKNSTKQSEADAAQRKADKLKRQAQEARKEYDAAEKDKKEGKENARTSRYTKSQVEALEQAQQQASTEAAQKALAAENDLALSTWAGDENAKEYAETHNVFDVNPDDYKQHGPEADQTSGPKDGGREAAQTSGSKDGGRYGNGQRDHTNETPKETMEQLDNQRQHLRARMNDDSLSQSEREQAKGDFERVDRQMKDLSQANKASREAQKELAQAKRNGESTEELEQKAKQTSENLSQVQTDAQTQIDGIADQYESIFDTQDYVNSITQSVASNEELETQENALAEAKVEQDPNLNLDDVKEQFHKILHPQEDKES